MNCLAWNCQGLGGSSAVHYLELHIRVQNPQIVFLSETKAKNRKIDFLKSKFDMHGVCVDSRGKSGGLALLWNKELHVDLQSFSPNHIDIHIAESDNPTGWRFTGFYGEPDTSHRHNSWDLLRCLASRSSKPWVCMGDFNAHLYNSEKEGGNRTPGYQLRDFRVALQDSGLTDLGYSGYPYTWSNGWEFPRTINVRIDRACISDSWLNKFPASKVRHLDYGGSDHCPILLHILDREIEQPNLNKRGFKFESMWMDDAECPKIVKNYWDEVGSNQRNNVWHKLESCREGLVMWHKSSFGGVSKKVAQIRKKIHSLKTGIVSESAKNEERDLYLQLEDLLGKEEKMWQQRAKAHWMREGDRNTRYFHSRATGRKKKNRILGVRREDGSWCNRQVEIENVVVDYFSNIFTSNHPSSDEINLVLGAMRSRVSSDDNHHLLQPYTAGEVYQALLSMYPLKSPGPDGFPPLFFQKFWPIVGKDVTNWVLGFLNDGIFDESCNLTNIVLIPKCNNPEYMTQFRPISLCNVVYKIASKTIANRLKPIMNSVISDYQSAFVPGRQITDNALVAFEITHFMKKLTRNRVGQMAIKLDLSKAYDRVEWEFLRAVMIRLGFDAIFVDLVMKCVTTVSYSFVLNGVNFGAVKPERGIRQGDPLSPYLFLFCAESLSALICQEERRGHLEGISICRGAPRVSHLLFADDTLIMCQATEEAAIHVNNLLLAYGLASGQNINFEKSSVVFTKNTEEDEIALILRSLPIRREPKHERYLGLPLTAGKSKREVFEYIRERVWSRLQSLKSRILSKAGKEILIKSIVQAIPSYLMSCFKLPVYLIKEIESLIARFWWDEGNTKKIHWVKWNALCSSKRDGGLGFRELESFNTSLLAKQAWRILVNPDNLLSRILKARYFPNTDLLNAQLGSSPSLTWRSIWESKKLLKLGIRWRVGNGNTIRIWGTNWLPRDYSFKVITPPCILAPDSTVSALLDHTRLNWNRNLIEDIFVNEEAQLILSIPLSGGNHPDRIIWHFDRSGAFTVRSAYKLCRHLKELELESSTGSSSVRSQFNWLRIWSLKTAPKVKHFIWSCCRNSLPVRTALRERKLIEEANCIRCEEEMESTMHCIVNCNYARQCWALSGLAFSCYWCNSHDFKDWFRHLSSKLDAFELGFATTLAWWIWFSRNKLLWERKDFEPADVVLFARKFYDGFKEAFPISSFSPSTRPINPNWNPPPPGTIKINVDAAVDEAKGSVGLGIVARDHEGAVLGWSSEKCDAFWDPLTAESIALLRGLELSIAKGWRHVILEGDCVLAVNGVLHHHSNNYFHPLGHIFEDIKLLAGNLDSFVCSHVFRENNSVAHALAKVAFSMFPSLFELPCFIYDLVTNDISQ
ncbi:hypothetical protein ACJIZ3_006380 [Penstemon smallii]|uniref:Reverse transcriptase domain-containing protein n=1 Tax=Penstemon smallii TaxID=265156 RepID=A0ABD3S7J8_9LAMI